MSTIARVSCVALAVLATTALAGGTASANADPLDCSAIVHDPAAILDREALDPVVQTVSARLDADVRVRVEGTLDSGLDRRIDQLVAQCPGWQDDDTAELADDMVIISFSVSERENSIYYGADLGPELEGRWDAATDAMIPGLRAGDYTDAVVAGLRGLTRDPVTSSGSSSGAPFGASSASDDSRDDTGGGVPGEVVFWLVVIGLVIVLSIVAKQQGWSAAGEDGWAGDDDGGTTSWFGGGSGRRRSSFRSFSSSRSRSRSSGGGSRRSSGGSRRAGGGTKKW